MQKTAEQIADEVPEKPAVEGQVTPGTPRRMPAGAPFKPSFSGEPKRVNLNPMIKNEGLSLWV